jgi:hypothetical protein
MHCLGITMELAVLQNRNRINLFVSGAYKMRINQASESETAYDTHVQKYMRIL